MRSFLAGAALLIAAIGALADGPGAYRPRERAATPAASLTDELSAIDAYNAGYAFIQRAEHQENIASASTLPREKTAALRSARASYEAALKKFGTAVEFDRSMHEAYTYLGYANRKLGQHYAALEAYEQALRIHSDFPHAIEYQGQAFLGLNRIDEAKFNYLRLYALDQAQAHKLLRAMKSWADANAATPPEGVDVVALKDWIAERERSHAADETVAGW
ncbi:MAG: hypothetical protein ACREV5_21780 [Steroidobacter sp.]